MSPNSRNLQEQYCKSYKVNSLEECRNIFMHSRIGIFVCTQDGNFVLANYALASIFGYASSEDFLKIIPDLRSMLKYTESETIKKLYRKLETKGSISDLKITQNLQDGTSVYLSLNISIYLKRFIDSLLKEKDGMSML